MKDACIISNIILLENCTECVSTHDTVQCTIVTCDVTFLKIRRVSKQKTELVSRDAT